MQSRLKCPHMARLCDAMKYSADVWCHSSEMARRTSLLPCNKGKEIGFTETDRKRINYNPRNLPSCLGPVYTEARQVIVYNANWSNQWGDETVAKRWKA